MTLLLPDDKCERIQGYDYRCNEFESHTFYSQLMITHIIFQNIYF